MSKQPQLKDKIILVTGASSGLGRALAGTLSELGVKIIAIARNEQALHSLQQDIEKKGGHCLCIPFDLLKFDHYTALFDALKEQIPRLDGIVHAAGDLKRCAPMQYVDSDAFRTMLDIHLTAPNLLTQAVFPLLQRSESASVIFTGCDMIENVQANWHGYGMAKAALNHAAEMWQKEHVDKPINFHVINPGLMRTPLMRRAFPGLVPESIPEAHERIDPFIDALAGK
ncbi:MAG: SDR family NAD(P)-dependent oxidoreductase [Mariprofundaceae bacterium]